MVGIILQKEQVKCNSSKFTIYLPFCIIQFKIVYNNDNKILICSFLLACLQPCRGAPTVRTFPSLFLLHSKEFTKCALD